MWHYTNKLMPLAQPVIRAKVQNKHEALLLVQETKKLREKCLELEKSEEELNYKVEVLTRDLEEAQQEFAKMSAELEALEVKGEKSIGNQGA
ncbi:hypothetical protein KSS87_007936 [Heliosperma pusillum]|nr:hypothetical protein KSS87_007936 [Heliosperma pusillum]